jgi:hypothetical protein
MSSNIGKIIKDSYCNGFFGREYDLNDAVIIAEGDEWIVIKKANGVIDFGNFQNWDWNRNDDGTLAGGISNLKTRSDKQELINEWCNY